jgi:hypothetical protein
LAPWIFRVLISVPVKILAQYMANIDNKSTARACLF